MTDLSKNDALAKLDESWNTLTAALDGIPSDRLTEPGVTGDWSVKDLLGHIAFWDRYSITQAERLLSGDTTPAEPHDTNALNAEDQKRKAVLDLAQIQDEFASTHASLVKAYQALPSLGTLAIEEDWIHYDEHAAEIRAWRERSGI